MFVDLMDQGVRYIDVFTPEISNLRYLDLLIDTFESSTLVDHIVHLVDVQVRNVQMHEARFNLFQFSLALVVL